MLGLLSGTWVKLGVGVLVVALIGAAIWHYNTLRTERDEFMVQVELERTAHLQTKGSFAMYREDAERSREQITRSMAGLAKATAEAAKQNRELVEKLSRHDLEDLSARKPGLLENRVNEATEAVRQQLQEISR